MSTRLAWLALVFSLLVTACGDSAPEAASTEPPVSCVEPPADELAPASPTALTVEPNPVAAGSEATLSIAADGLPTDAIVGAGAAWQCWNGTGWTDTHQIVRGSEGTQARTLEVEPGATTTIPAVGLPVPNSYPILIPDVTPGMYRIEDYVSQTAGTWMTGWVFVEVVSGGE